MTGLMYLPVRSALVSDDPDMAEALRLLAKQASVALRKLEEVGLAAQRCNLTGNALRAFDAAQARKRHP